MQTNFAYLYVLQARFVYPGIGVEVSQSSLVHLVRQLLKLPHNFIQLETHWDENPLCTSALVTGGLVSPCYKATLQKQSLSDSAGPVFSEMSHQSCPFREGYLRIFSVTFLQITWGVGFSTKPELVPLNVGGQ